MGAMCGPSPTAVTPRLSGRRLFDRRGLFLRQRRLATGPRGSPWRRPASRSGRGGCESTQPLPVGVEQREREALVAAGVLERVEPHEPDALERPRRAALERAVRATSRSTSRPSTWTRSRWAPSTSSRSPSSPRVEPAQPSIEGSDRRASADDRDDQHDERDGEHDTIGPRLAETAASRSMWWVLRGGRPESSSRLSTAATCPGNRSGWCYPLPLATLTASTSLPPRSPDLTDRRILATHGEARTRHVDETGTATSPAAPGPSAAAEQPGLAAVGLADARGRGTGRGARGRDRRGRATAERAAATTRERPARRDAEPRVRSGSIAVRAPRNTAT